MSSKKYWFFHHTIGRKLYNNQNSASFKNSPRWSPSYIIRKHCKFGKNLRNYFYYLLLHKLCNYWRKFWNCCKGNQEIVWKIGDNNCRWAPSESFAAQSPFIVPIYNNVKSLLWSRSPTGGSVRLYGIYQHHHENSTENERSWFTIIDTLRFDI